MNAAAPGTPDASGLPIAVVGLSCRFPSADSPAEFWRLLHEGRHAIREAPAGRAPGLDRLGTPPRGGFLDDVAGFDADFFSIAPREAAVMDPQQRLVLELAWEALEDARIRPATLRGSRTGVWIGAISDDYATLSGRLGPGAITQHTFTGLQRGVIANRVSYLTGARGPSLTVDCGQASSLVAVHQACESLRRGESTAALAGGVQLNLLPDVAERVRAFGALSPDARCYTFDARANGFVRGEGGGMVMLKPLARALADGDRVYAVILGGAVNNGSGAHLTAPDEQAQRQVLELAWQAAGADPGAAGHIELHGTGTPAGDPVEAAALGAVLGAARPAGNPLPVGSVKTNIGHLEGAAGIAGLIKTVLSIRHGLLPASLNHDRPHPEVPLERLNLAVQNRLSPWPPGPLLAGVSSFGVGGTNCHLVLSGPPDRPAATAPTAPARSGRPIGPWLVHARHESALATQAARLAAHLREHPDLDAADVGYSLALTRSPFEHRAAITAHDRAGLVAGLDALASGEPAASVTTGFAARPRRVVFAFPGQGSQWPLMARQLLRDEDAFAAAVHACARELDPVTGWDLRAVLDQAPDAAPLDRVDVLQPALFAVMVALAELWRAHGVQPEAVIGHSQGEVAAACVAGALSLRDAARIVAVRSRLVRRELSGLGGMASVRAGRDVLAGRLRPFAGKVSVAAANGPTATVIAGETAALDQVIAALEADGVQVRRIPVDYASHSTPVGVLREKLINELTGIEPMPARVPFYSSVTGGPVEGTSLDALYWYRNLREEVRFDDASAALLADGFDAFVECAPHPVLSAALRETADAADRETAVIPSLVRDEGGAERFRTSLAAAHVNGVEVDWRVTWERSGAAAVPLPTYAFLRQPYWLTGTGTGTATTGTATTGTDTATAGTGTSFPAQARSAGPRATTTNRFMARLAAAPQAERRRIAQRLVAETVAGVFGHADADDVAPDRTFRDLGLDSLLAVQLGDRLRAATGLPVTARTLFDHPTCTLLARHIEAAAADVPGGRGAEPAGIAPEPEPAEVPEPPALPPLVPWSTPPGPRPAADEPDEPVATGSAVSAPVPVPRHEEPVAVVGLACRFPGAEGVRAFWRLLTDGVDAVRAVPQDRWPTAGAMGPLPPPVERAGLLSGDTDRFDALFFGISPREAAEMDPQQRLFLEVAWEALEDAGLADGRLEGSRTGVFAGVTFHDFSDLNPVPTGPVSPYTATGRALNMVPNRLSYALGLRGPSVAVDTACSSSLLAVHLACRSIRDGECDTAIVGGVNLLLSGGTSVALKEFGGLSSDGRCKAFDARADGYGRGEGSGVVVLKPLSRALADGDDIWCTVRGSAANNDGHSNGLTAPSPKAQEEVLRDAYRRAGVSARDVSLLEAHGTGTALGDEIEATVLGTVLGAGREQDAPLLLGSVKTNIGHLEAAAGVAGFIKTALALKHRTVPRSLHFDTPNPGIDFAGLGLRVPTATEPWPAGGPALAGVSSFGWGGTNVHVVMEGWEAAEARQAPAAGGQCAGAVFVCAPGGSRWPGMARQLLRSEPAFREAVERCDREFARCTGRSLLDALHGEEDPGPVAEFAVQLGLAAWLESRGVVPEAVVGCGLGEITAAVVAGVLEPADGIRLALGYGEHLAHLEAAGDTRAVMELDRDDLRTALAQTGGRIRVAAVYGARTAVVAGPAEEVRALAATWAGRGARCAVLPGAAGCPDASGATGESFTAAVGPVSPGPGRIPLYSSLNGTALDWPGVGTGYFARLLGEPTRLADAVDELLAAGHGLFLEIGTDPLLTEALRQSADDSGTGALVLPTMSRSDAGCTGTLGALERLTRADPRGPGDAALVTLAARTPGALRELAGRVAAAVGEEGFSGGVHEVAAALARRADHPYRAAVVAHDLLELESALRSFCDGDRAAGVIAAPEAVRRAPEIRFVFPDHLGGDAGAAVEELLRSEPVFRAQVRKWDRLLAPAAGRSVLAELRARTDGSPTGGALSPPALFTVQTALAALLCSWGLKPDSVTGRGAGAVSAAWASGGLPLPEAVESACAGDGARAFQGHRRSEATVALVPPPRDAADLPADRAPSGEAAADTVVEVSLRPVLVDNDGAALLPGHRRHERSRGGRDALLEALGVLYTRGAPVLRALRPARHTVKLPTYPWQGERYPAVRTRAPHPSAVAEPLLGGRVDPATEPGTHYWQTRWSAKDPRLSRWAVSGAGGVPEEVLRQAALGAAAEVLGTGPHTVVRTRRHGGLVLPEGGARTVQTVLTRGEGTASVRMFGLEESGPVPLVEFELRAREAEPSPPAPAVPSTASPGPAVPGPAAPRPSASGAPAGTGRDAAAASESPSAPGAAEAHAPLTGDHPHGPVAADHAHEPAAGPHEDMLAFVRETVAEAVGLPAREVDAAQPVRELGVTSVMALDLRNRWETHCGVRLSPTVVWNYPTVGDIAALLVKKRGARRPAPHAPSDGPTPRRHEATTPSAAPAADPQVPQGSPESADPGIQLERELAALRQSLEDLKA
ncbi:hypothetical protein GCM10018793_47010 [Streptomyces sulfonofaciens]|uniref:Type I polyketide synthase n=1 Tax=Streptomyces sulfonofaciens TaxID=68272 RepID=A0A919GGA2_9ACTN|nr:type I polyketide synthase [Streptomyces sulfonofaciens]GHH83869.1 hypothetical protein GCM10018793_47010 [Streptomyces sulfonofaciens]